MLLLGTALGTGCSTVQPTSSPSIDAFARIRWPERADLSPDGVLYFIHDPDGIRQLYKVRTGGRQADAIRLTHFEDGISGYSLSRDGQHLAITAAKGGSEQTDLFLMNPSTVELQPLFEDPDVVYASPLWRRDSAALAYRANADSRKDFHVYVYDLETKLNVKVMSGSGHHDPADFSRDGSRLVVGKYNSASHSQLFEVTLETGEVRELTPTDEEWSFVPVGYTADERAFLVNTNYRGDLKRVCALDLTTGNIVPVFDNLGPYEVDFASFNEDRTLLAVGLNQDGYRTLRLFRASDFTPVELPAMGEGIVSNVTFTAPYMLYSLSNTNTPGLVYRWNTRRSDEPPVTLTEADTQGIDVSAFRLPELVHYPSFDGTKIPAFLYLPTGYRPGQKTPFIAYYHGGPESQFRPGFNKTFQYFLSEGYGIIAPNVRGSSGYGKAYIEADDYKNRHKSVRDGIWAAKYVIDQGYTTSGRVAAWGGSYGGFMVMAVITEAPELFGAACNVVGIVNFQTFLEQTKDYRRHLREAEYGPLDDPAFLAAISPIHKVDRIQTPLMIAHGLNDPRVPVGEAMQIAVALKKRGVDVEELYFPDEGHGFAKEGNRLLYYDRLARFFDQHLR